MSLYSAFEYMDYSGHEAAHDECRLSYVRSFPTRCRLLIPSQPALWQSVITILLSTYNGERFLAAQLDSFLAQSYENWGLHWPDDGSTDGTVGIMRDFTARLEPGRCMESPSSGEHLGASTSFLTLLAECDSPDAAAFADQDDVWLPEKLRCAVEHLAQAGPRPMLYCARQYLVNEALQRAKLSVAHLDTPGFPACITQNIANGNTLVMNTAAAALVTSMGQPEGTVHDWWSYIVVSACGGKIVFDERPQVLYRLHKNNLIGSSRPLPARAMAAIRRGPAIFMTMMRRHTDTLAAQSNLLSPPGAPGSKACPNGLAWRVVTPASRIALPAIAAPHDAGKSAVRLLVHDQPPGGVWPAGLPQARPGGAAGLVSARKPSRRIGQYLLVAH